MEKATYSLGIFEAKTNKLIRQLQTAANEKDFTVGTNGLITAWDGKDEAGRAAPPGHYTARGYAVGPLKIEGEEIQDNDWTAGDEALRISHVDFIEFSQDDNGLVMLAALAGGQQQLIRFAGPDNVRVLWHAPVSFDPKNRPESMILREGEILFFPAVKQHLSGYRYADPLTTSKGEIAYSLRDGAPKIGDPQSGALDAPNPSSAQQESQPPFPIGRYMASGKPGTGWMADGKDGLVQLASDRQTILRRLEVKLDEPPMQQVAASRKEDRLYLLEEMPGWQRVRGLVWLETKEESGKPISTWQTFFERNIHQPASSRAGSKEEPVEVNLDENPLLPGKPGKARLIAVFDAKGSYLATKDGLRLRQVSERPDLVNAYLANGQPPNPVEFFQYDGAATDEFSIKGVHRMMEFDAGEFELTAAGEKPAGPKPTEPPDL